MRHRDVSLLAVGKFVYISDDRFKVLHESDSEEWLLSVRSVSYADEGVYECQVNAENAAGATYRFFLTVVGQSS